MRLEINLADPYVLSVIAGILFLGLAFWISRLTPKKRVFFTGIICALACAFVLPAILVFKPVIPHLENWIGFSVYALLFSFINTCLFLTYFVMTKCDSDITFYKSPLRGIFNWLLAAICSIALLWLGQFFNINEQDNLVFVENLSAAEKYLAVSGTIFVGLLSLYSLVNNFLAINGSEWENC